MKCAVGNCKSSNSQKSTVSFYSFPKDAAQRKLWIKFCNRWKNVDVQKDKICSLHFKKEDIERNLKYEMGFSRRRTPKLKPGAVPTIVTSAIESEKGNENQTTLEIKTTMLGKAIYEWIRRMIYYKNILITDSLIQELALQFKSAMGLQDFFPYKDWCDKFRISYNIPTCDSKALNIGYTHSRSLQVKDVMKHISSECSPNSGGDDYAEVNVNERDGEDNGMSNFENDYITIYSDKTEMRVKTKLKKIITKQNVQANAINESPSKPIQLGQHTQLQGIKHLVALPLQTNSIPGIGQKMLIVPITPNGQNQGNAPMTMTILPLAAMAQTANILNVAATVKVTPASKPLNNAKNNVEDQVSVPPPILEIKKEIKEEPKDENEFIDIPLADFNIKKENLTDDEYEQDVANTQTNVATPLANSNMIEDFTNDSLDLTLPSLRKRLKTEDTSSSSSEANKYPALNECQRIDEYEQEETLPAIRSYREARKYLKLLEDFAFERENFRLIGLITKADEVLRESDHQENSEDEI